MHSREGCGARSHLPPPLRVAQGRVGEGCLSRLALSACAGSDYSGLWAGFCWSAGALEAPLPNPPLCYAKGRELRLEPPSPALPCATRKGGSTANAKGRELKQEHPSLPSPALRAREGAQPARGRVPFIPNTAPPNAGRRGSDGSRSHQTMAHCAAHVPPCALPVRIPSALLHGR